MGKLDDDLMLSNGKKMAVPKIYPLDAVYDRAEDVPEEVKSNKASAMLPLIGETVASVVQKLVPQIPQIRGEARQRRCRSSDA